MPVLVAGVLTMSAAQLLDLATFMALMRQVGPAAEANPLVAALFAAHGMPAVAIAKVLLLAGLSGIVAVLARPAVRPGLAAAVLAVAIGVGLIGGLSNSIAVGAVDAVIERAGLGGP